MNFSLLALFAVAAHASDDQSLMQHGVGVGASKADVQASLAAIKQGLDEIPNPGKVRQMAIDALMKSVSDAEEINDDVVASLNSVLDLLGTILTTFESAAGIDQNTLDAHGTDAATCNSNGWDVDADHNTSHTTAHGNHDTCRTEQVTYTTTEHTKCTTVESTMTTMTSYQTNSESGYCQKLANTDPMPATSAERTAALTAWRTFVQEGTTHWETRLEHITTQVGECNTAMTELTTKDAACDALQLTTDVAFCEWMYHRQSMCTTNAGCHADAVAAYDADWATLSAAGDERVTHARVIHAVMCLLNHLIADRTPDLNPVTGHKAICDGEVAANASDYEDKYNVDPVTLDDQRDCDSSHFANYPNVGNSTMNTLYMAEQYADHLETSAHSGLTCSEAAHR